MSPDDPPDPSYHRAQTEIAPLRSASHPRPAAVGAIVRAGSALLASWMVVALPGCGGQPNCDPHPCPSWSRLDPYSCACVDIDSAEAREPLTQAGEPASCRDAGPPPSRHP